MKNSRNSTLEILRIISMIMVIGLHYMNKTIGGGLNTELKGNIVSSHIIESICITSVNVFVLISGYFMQSAKTTGLKKAVNLYLVMLFYNLSCFGIAAATGQYPFSVRELILAVFPFFAGLKWFLQTYMILLLIAPFINKLLNCLNQESHGFLIFIQIMLFSFPVHLFLMAVMASPILLLCTLFPHISGSISPFKTRKRRGGLHLQFLSFPA